MLGIIGFCMKCMTEFVKDSKNKVTEVYLDIATYDAIVKKIKNFNKKVRSAKNKT